MTGPEHYLALEAVWQLSQAPAWLGWTLITGGLCALSWLAGAHR